MIAAALVLLVICCMISLVLIGVTCMCEYNYGLLQIIFPNIFKAENYYGNWNPLLFGAVFILVIIFVSAICVFISKLSSLAVGLYFGSTLVPAFVCLIKWHASMKLYIFGLILGIFVGFILHYSFERKLSEEPRLEWNVSSGIVPFGLLLFDAIFMNISMYNEFVLEADVDALLGQSAIKALIPTAIILALILGKQMLYKFKKLF